MPSVVDQLLACYAELRHHLLGRLRYADDAADVAQTSFMQAYACALLRPVDCPRALLYRTAHNLLIDRHRRAGTEAATLNTWAALQPTEAPCTERTVAARQGIEKLARRLERMPRLRAEVFVLVRVAGHSHAETGARLGLSIAAIEQHVVRATLDLSQLAAALELGVATKGQGVGTHAHGNPKGRACSSGSVPAPSTAAVA